MSTPHDSATARQHAPFEARWQVVAQPVRQPVAARSIRRQLDAVPQLGERRDAQETFAASGGWF